MKLTKAPVILLLVVSLIFLAVAGFSMQDDDLLYRYPYMSRAMIAAFLTLSFFAIVCAVSLHFRSFFPAFLILSAAFIALHIYDGVQVWHIIVGTLPKEIGESLNKMHIHSSMPYSSCAFTLMGAAASLFPVAAFAFLYKKKRLPAALLSGFTMLCAILIAYILKDAKSTQQNILFIFCILFAFSAALTLLRSLNILKSRFWPTLLLFFMGILSVGIFLYLSQYQTHSNGLDPLKYYGGKGIRAILRSNYNLSRASARIAAVYYPLSFALIFVAHAAGMLCCRSQEAAEAPPVPAAFVRAEPRTSYAPTPAPVPTASAYSPSPSSTPAPSASFESPSSASGTQKAATSAEILNKLERLAKLREQGILTDEEFQKKKQDLLSRM